MDLSFPIIHTYKTVCNFPFRKGPVPKNAAKTQIFTETSSVLDGFVFIVFSIPREEFFPHPNPSRRRLHRLSLTRVGQ
jgi:hypothetical protein